MVTLPPLPVFPAPEAALVAGLAAAATGVVWSIGEVLHARRLGATARLAFGDRGRPAAWATTAAPLRVLAAAAAVFGLTVLLLLAPTAHGGRPLDERRVRHLVVVLDVSPSMQLADAGPRGDQRRRARAAELVRSVLDRVPVGQYRVSVVAVAAGALPVVEESRDPEVLANILDDLPLSYAFPAGKTDLFAGLAEAARMAKPWRPGSATVLVVTDGDTVPATGLPRMPESVSGLLLVGVGDPQAGRFIDGHMSRQDAGTLRQVAARSGGLYHDGNARQVPTASLVALGMVPQERLLDRLGLRELALAMTVLGTAVLALLPAALERWGTAWKPGVPGRPGVRRLPREAILSSEAGARWTGWR
ncbi:MAG: VWA domain-containing protein [Planctomycetia bacterium]|nr:VWA domain-containing protein [Planctomycetia bacterium]